MYTYMVGWLVGWLGFRAYGTFSTNRLYRAIKERLKFVEDVYFR